MFITITEMLCLLIWIGWLIHGINCYIREKEVDKIAFISATLIYILYFAEQILLH